MYNHSVTLEAKKCIGCTDCIKRCPTEAIRVRDAKAKIIHERCIDCGNCIAVCRNGAKQAVMDDLGMIRNYKYPVVMPAPAFYAQFSKCERVDTLLATFYDLGFVDHIEVAQAAEYIAKQTKDYIQENRQYPIISSACPVIVRLIQRRFPSLIDQILPIMSPMELAARMAKESYKQKGIKEEDVGVFFVSPCPAKRTDIKKPKGYERSYVDGVLSMQTMYKAMVHRLGKHKEAIIRREKVSDGISWAMRNGAVNHLGIDNYIAVDGIESVIAILEKVEDGTLENIQYIEALGCIGGCLGGPLVVENPFISRYTLKKFIQKDCIKEGCDSEVKQKSTLASCIDTKYTKPITPRPVFSLNENLEVAIEMMEAIETLYSKLPGIDCGSCGAPTCKCFAEDVIKGFAHTEDCVFMLKERIKALSEDMLELTRKLIPTENEEGKE